MAAIIGVQKSFQRSGQVTDHNILISFQESPVADDGAGHIGFHTGHGIDGDDIFILQKLKSPGGRCGNKVAFAGTERGIAGGVIHVNKVDVINGKPQLIQRDQQVTIANGARVGYDSFTAPKVGSSVEIRGALNIGRAVLINITVTSCQDHVAGIETRKTDANHVILQRTGNASCHTDPPQVPVAGRICFELRSTTRKIQVSGAQTVFFKIAQFSAGHQRNTALCNGLAAYFDLCQASFIFAKRFGIAAATTGSKEHEHHCQNQK